MSRGLGWLQRAVIDLLDQHEQWAAAREAEGEPLNLYRHCLRTGEIASLVFPSVQDVFTAPHATPHARRTQVSSVRRALRNLQRLDKAFPVSNYGWLWWTANKAAIERHAREHPPMTPEAVAALMTMLR